MLESKASQFSLSPEGQILWQEKINNPVPGVPVAQLEKGAHALKPVIKVLECDATKTIDQAELSNHLNVWLKTYMNEVMEPLMLLEVPQGVTIKDDPVSKIAARVYDGLGIVPREELEPVIAELTPETRADLRAKKIRLGPILVFIPALNKPAAVKLRALLWSIFHDVTLPAKVPADGIVSSKVDEDNPNEEYYRAIGYPIYGGRAVRIDMLDRVISCVYDHADGGKFKARHEMAEWLGCSIEDLYKVLEAMGHTKIYDPAEQEEQSESAPSPQHEDKPQAQADKSETKAQAADVQKQDDKPEKEVKQTEEKEKAESSEQTQEQAQKEDSTKPDDGAREKPTEEGAEENKDKKQEEKPELATFRLKKGKAFQKAGGKGGRKPFDKSKKASSKKDNRKTDHKKKNKDKKSRDKGPRVISLEAEKNEEDSPFAILQQLKK